MSRRKQQRKQGMGRRNPGESKGQQPQGKSDSQEIARRLAAQGAHRPTDDESSAPESGTVR